MASESWLKSNLLVFKNESVFLGEKTLSDLQKLLGNDGQYFDVDSVELIEADPSTRGGETLEVLGDEQVVHTVRAVEDDALFGKSLCQIFSRLSLTSTGWTSRSTS